MTVCPMCHQMIACERLGVRMPSLKARIIDLIKAAGDVGVTLQELTYDVYRDSRRKRSPHTIKAHIWQINELLEETDWRIVRELRGFRDRKHREPPRWHLSIINNEGDRT